MLHRATVLEDIVRILPPEVAARVNSVVASQLDQNAGIEQVLAGSPQSAGASGATSSAASGAAAASGDVAPADAAAAELDEPSLPGFSRELESWVTLAHMLAAEVASLESQLQDVKLRPEKATSLLRRVNEKLKSSAREMEEGVSSEGGQTVSGTLETIRPDSGEPSFIAPPTLVQHTPPEESPSAQRHARKPTGGAALECSQIRLLIVEDDEFQRNALRQQSVRVGFAAVHTAATGEDALQMISGGLAVDLCLLDINLGPGITGVEVLQRIQQLEQLDELATVMLSADDSPAVIEQCLIENADSFVLMPPSNPNPNPKP